MRNTANRRISERVILNPHMVVSITPISTCNSSVVESLNVCVLDIGIDGLKFKSNESFEINTEMVFAFNRPTWNDTFIIQGHVVHNKTLPNMIEYGVELFMNDSETDIFLEFLEAVIHDKLPQIGIYAYNTCQCES